MLSIGMSNYALKHSQEGTGNSYFLGSDKQLISMVEKNWDNRIPGAGESGIDRKVLVPVPPEQFICAPKMELKIGMPVQARVTVRQDGEDPYIETFITPEDASEWGWTPTPAKEAQIVCYSAEALMENGGKRSTDCDFEIVTILGFAKTEEPKYMLPLSMARNYLEMPGGTKGDYSAQEFAESIYYNSKRGISVRR